MTFVAIGALKAKCPFKICYHIAEDYRSGCCTLIVFWCCVALSVIHLFIVAPWVGLLYVIVAFPVILTCFRQCGDVFLLVEFFFFFFRGQFYVRCLFCNDVQLWICKTIDQRCMEVIVKGNKMILLMYNWINAKFSQIMYT